MASGLDAFFLRLNRGFYHSVCVLVTHAGGFVRSCMLDRMQFLVDDEDFVE